MADSGIFRINPLQGWQRDAILKAAQLLRDRFGENDDQAGAARDGLLEVLDPARRTARLQKEISDATRAATPPEKTERRQRERRGTDRRKANASLVPDQSERRRRQRRTGERRTKR
jgi:hypothetical protein